MTDLLFDEGSFKNPDGRILSYDDHVFRYFNQSAAEKHRAFRDSGLLISLVPKGWIVDALPVLAEISDELNKALPQAALFVEHPWLPFISYCYEWPFEMLQAAAIHHLDLLLETMDAGYV